MKDLMNMEQIMKKMCELCEMGRVSFDDGFECVADIFPCSRVREVFDEVIKILEEQK